MEYKAFMIKYAEIGTKGKNRYVFEDILCKNIRTRLKKCGEFTIKKEYGRIYVVAEAAYDYEDTVKALQSVFGIVGICPVVMIEDTGFENLKQSVIAYMDMCYPDKNKTFKVHTRRSDKTYPIPSMEMNSELGHVLLEAYPQLSVDVHAPDILLQVEVRQTGAYIYSLVIAGPGGLPIGTNGSAMLLLSGGIDSPVAGYMIAKRGVAINAVYFHAPPYTSDRAKQKVVDLARLVSAYTGPIRLHIVNFTDIQMAIYENCPHEELTIIMRRYMMKIAEAIAEQEDCLGLITGESIGQVASQTMHSLYVTNEVCHMPVFRPCIGMDKQEIVDIAEKIDTYETSILPYEDCCTIFVAKHPVTKPRLAKIKESEALLSEIIGELYQKALDTLETVTVR
ncbi:MAG: tRNA 4-thiouridine(8) synthase ThiI [Lachnospiraceae bacterium]|nr:tRNA 4-thiouridine(8) synthase ThiI [Lachnospiraceae bacterium]